MRRDSFNPEAPFDRDAPELPPHDNDDYAWLRSVLLWLTIGVAIGGMLVFAFGVRAHAADDERQDAFGAVTPMEWQTILLRIHMHDRPDLDQWLAHLSSKDRGPCCDSTEAETMADPDWRSGSEMKPGECKKGDSGITSDKPPAFCVRLEYPDPEDKNKFEWWEVPPGAVVMKNETEPEPNRAGPALIWFYWVRNGGGIENMNPYIRCFLPGSLS